MGGVGRRIEEAIELIEMELRHAAAYVNDAVIPQVRAESRRRRLYRLKNWSAADRDACFFARASSSLSTSPLRIAIRSSSSSSTVIGI